MSSSVLSSTTLQSWRDRSPTSFSLKIQNLSQFEKSTTFCEENYKSCTFSSGGYEWRMIIYPRGNEKDEGRGFISMYVELDNTSLLFKPQVEVFADLRFFVYNKKEHKYFTLQYLESKAFNRLRTVWGLSQVLPLDTFNDLKNGYVFDGNQCEVGVDVFVASPPTNWEILSLNENPSDRKFSWNLKNFSDLKESMYTSDSFLIGARKWALELYPKGDTRADGKWLSIYLRIAESETLEKDEKIFTQVEVRLVDPRGSNHLILDFSDWYNKSTHVWGYEEFISLTLLPKIYLDEDGSLNVEIKFDVVSESKYPPKYLSKHLF